MSFSQTFQKCAFYSLSFLIISCASREDFEIKEYTKDFSSTFVERSYEKELISLPGDSVDVAIFVDERICLFKARTEENKCHLKILDGESGEGLADLVPHGREEGHMVLPFFSYGDDKICLHDPILGRVFLIDIDEMLSNQDCIPLVYETNIVSQTIVPYGERFMFLNPYSFTGEESRVLFTNRKARHSRRKMRVNMMNVLFGSLSSGNSGESIVFVSENSPEIEILDSRGKVKTILYFQHKESEYAKVDVGGIKTYVFKEPIINCFWDGCARNKYIAALYDDEYKGRRVVLVLDWDGNIIDGFIPDGVPKRISLSSDERFLYSWESSESVDHLVKYQIID